MHKQNYGKLVFVNASGNQVILSDKTVDHHWEFVGRYGFSAPEVQYITETYANGVTKILKRIVQPRTCGVRMFVYGKTSAKRDEEFFDMISGLMDVSNGEVGRLYVTRSDGSTVYLNCAYMSGLNVKDEYYNFHKFNLEFYAADPYFYRDLDDVYINVPLSARLTLHDELYLSNNETRVHVLGENTGLGTGMIRNNGSDVIQPVMRISRVKGSLTIENERNGDKIEFNDILIPRGDTLVIDTRENEKDIYIEHSDGTISPAGQYLNWGNIEFDFNLPMGENVIKFQVGSRSTTDGMTFQLSERYLSA